MQAAGEVQGATAGTSLRSGRMIQVPNQRTRGCGDQERPIYEEEEEEAEVFSPCKDSIDGMNDGSVRPKRTKPTNQRSLQDIDLANSDLERGRRSPREHEDQEYTSRQSQRYGKTAQALFVDNNEDQYQQHQEDNRYQPQRGIEQTDRRSTPGRQPNQTNRMPARLPLNPNQMRVKPPVFDGTTTWSNYLTQFELVAEMNDWNQHQKALNLATSLRGEAQSILGDLDAEGIHDYFALVNQLNQRFGSEHQTEMFRAILRNRVRQPRETLPTLAHEIRKLVKQAYPTGEHGLLDNLAKEHFIDSLPDADTRWKIHQSRPRNLDESVRVAVELEAFQMAEQHRSGKKAVRLVKAENNTNTDDMENNIAYQQADTTLNDLPKILENMSKQLERLQPKRSYDDKKRSRGCFICNDPGHYQRDCPQNNDPRRQRNRNNHWNSGN